MFKYYCFILCLFGFATKLYSQSTLYYNGKIFTSNLKEPFVGYFVVENGMISETGEVLPAIVFRNFQTKLTYRAKLLFPVLLTATFTLLTGP